MNEITSGKSAVPESILRHKLKGKMVKALGGHVT